MSQEKKMTPEEEAKLQLLFETTKPQAEERMTRSLTMMQFSEPLYQYPLLLLKKIPTLDCPTMGVGASNMTLFLVYNPIFVMRLSEEELSAVLKHEAAHVLLQHLTRSFFQKARPKMWNIAADFTINPRIRNIPKWGLFPKENNFEDNQSAEMYYKLLMKRKEEKIEQIKKGMKAAGMIGQGTPGEGDEDDEFIDSLIGEALDDHSGWDHINESDMPLVYEKIKEMSLRAVDAQNAKGWGNIAGISAEEILAANVPIVNWRRELRYFLNRFELYGHMNTRKRPSRRYGYVQPGTKKDYKSRVLVAIDTSGSVASEELAMFLTELNSMIGHAVVDLIFFDYVVHGEPIRFRNRKKTLDFKGRGGTNFDAPMQMAANLQYDGLIMMTDGECSFPPKPRYQVLWAICPRTGRHIDPPYGKKIVIE